MLLARATPAVRPRRDVTAAAKRRSKRADAEKAELAAERGSGATSSERVSGLAAGEAAVAKAIQDREAKAAARQALKVKSSRTQSSGPTVEPRVGEEKESGSPSVFVWIFTLLAAIGVFYGLAAAFTNLVVEVFFPAIFKGNAS
mmetsp:Transcript_24727/g.80867  ORF Transcript_24727/g.80867 Transcript_24727/m.80867 type:complete len:144 (-) Transcript_24727:2331-2762(-)